MSASRSWLQLMLLPRMRRDKRSTVIVVLLSVIATLVYKQQLQQQSLQTAASHAADAGLHQSQLAYRQLFDRHESICSTGNSHNNLVLNLPDDESAPPSRAYRPWSLTHDSYHYDPQLLDCGDRQSLLNSVRLGQRAQPTTAWLSTAVEDLFDPEAKFRASSSFRPHGCNYQWHTSDSACAVVSRFSDISFIGDSQTRHTTQQLFSLLTGNLITGALPLLSPSPLYQQCVCDGQFSEHKLCRSWSDAMWNVSLSHAYGLCPLSRPFHFSYTQDHSSSSSSSICHSDTRPRLVYLSAGLHYKSDAQRTITEFIEPLLLQLDNTLRDCEYHFPVLVLWSGLSYMLPDVTAKYPHQAMERVLLFNTQIEQHLQKRAAAAIATAAAEVTVICTDFFNLTKGAATSDGE